MKSLVCAVLMVGASAATITRPVAAQQRIRGLVTDERGKVQGDVDVALGSRWTHDWHGLSVDQAERTKADGSFRIVDYVYSQGSSVIWAATRDRSRIGFAPLSKSAGAETTIVLHPATQVCLRYFRSATSRPAGAGRLDVLGGQQLNLPICTTPFDGALRVYLPPGLYRFDGRALGDVIETPFELEVKKGDDLLDLGDIAVGADAATTRRNYVPPTFEFGGAAAPWTFAATRHAPASFGPETYRGKWVLMLFLSSRYVEGTTRQWATAAAFWRRFSKHRHRFQIVTVADRGIETVAAMEPLQKAFAEAARGEIDPKFPLGLDRDDKTGAKYGVTKGWTQFRLIDPEGKVIEGDVDRLAMELVKTEPAVAALIARCRAASAPEALDAALKAVLAQDDERAAAVLWEVWNEAQIPTVAVANALVALASRAPKANGAADFSQSIRRQVFSRLTTEEGLLAAAAERRTTAATALAAGPEWVQAHLLSVLIHDADAEVRRAALRSLRLMTASPPASGGAAAPEALPPEPHAWPTSDRRFTPVIAFVRALDDAVPKPPGALRALLRHAMLFGEGYLRGYVLEKGGLQHPRKEIRAAAAGAVSDRGNPFHRPLVESLLQDPEESVRAAAKVALESFDALASRTRKATIKLIEAR